MLIFRMTTPNYGTLTRNGQQIGSGWLEQLPAPDVILSDGYRLTREIDAPYGFITGEGIAHYREVNWTTYHTSN
jgi:hypothetical protein